MIIQKILNLFSKKSEIVSDLPIFHESEVPSFLMTLNELAELKHLPTGTALARVSKNGLYERLYNITKIKAMATATPNDIATFDDLIRQAMDANFKTYESLGIDA